MEVARQGGHAITQPARFAFDSEQIAVIKRTVAKDCDDNEFIMFMEVVGRYQLDPFVKQVYAAKMGGVNGSGGQVTILVSRDGLLAMANRYTPDTHPHDYFKGIEGDVVREGDSLERKADGTFVHTYSGRAEERARRRILGAWARCLREGRVPTFFYAPFDSYKTGNRTWQRYPDAMILKVAESMVLRKAFSISGIVGEDEVGMTYGATPVPSADAPEVEIDYGPDEKQAAYLKALFERANELRPNSFAPQKVRFTLAAADDEKRARITRDVEQFILRNGGELPDPDALNPAEEPVEEAEVVDDDAATAAAA